MMHLDNSKKIKRAAKHCRKGWVLMTVFRFTCDECKKELGYFQKNCTSKFCRKCSAKSTANKISGENHCNWKGIKLLAICKCGSKKNPYSKTCFRCVDLSGDKNPNWKGENSTTSINQLVRSNPIYKTWVKAIMKRDDYTCQFTGQRGGELEVHHQPKELFELIEDARKNFTEKTQVINHVLERHKDLSIGITVSKKYHKTVIHKDSYNFKYQERQTYPQAKEVIAINLVTKERNIFSSTGKAAKATNTSSSTVSRIARVGELKSRNNWTFFYSNNTSEDLIQQRIKALSIPKEKRKLSTKEMNRLTAFCISKRKKVQCVETGKIFNSMTEAANATGLNRTSIKNILNGRYKQIKGHSFILISG